MSSVSRELARKATRVYECRTDSSGHFETEYNQGYADGYEDAVGDALDLLKLEEFPTNYKRKPSEVKAFQLDERGLVGEDWFWDAVSANDIIIYNFGKDYTDHIYCEIKTAKGIATASCGDFIICNSNGEIYPCKEETFYQKYEKI